MRSLPFEQTAKQPGQEAAWILDRALSFIEPRALDFSVDFRLVDEPYLKNSNVVQNPTWHVRREDVNPNQARPVVQALEGHQDRTVPDIDASALERVFAEALAQPAPPHHCVTLERLTVTKLHARVLRMDLAHAQTLSVWRIDRFEFAVPIAHDARGAWIVAYPDALDQPLELEIDNIDGTVRVRVNIGWSLWEEEGSAEHAAIVDFARVVIARGYEIRSLDDAFRKYLP